jgi:hypothetical protein
MKEAGLEMSCDAIQKLNDVLAPNRASRCEVGAGLSKEDGAWQ